MSHSGSRPPSTTLTPPINPTIPNPPSHTGDPVPSRPTSTQPPPVATSALPIYLNTNLHPPHPSSENDPTNPQTSDISPLSSHYPQIPSNAAIEQIIANAMALAGSGPSSNSGSSVTNGNGNAGMGEEGAADRAQMQGQGMGGAGGQAGSGGGGRGSFSGMGQGSGRGQMMQGYMGGMGYNGSMQGMGGGSGSGNVSGSGGVGGGGGSAAGGRLGGTIGTYQIRSHTPIMFHPVAVGVDGRVNLFVGNLPYRVRWQDVKDLFRRAGTVLRADVSLDPQTNRSRGHGSVLMGSQEDGIKAIEMFNGYNWQTRILEVRPDRLPPEYEPQPYVPSGSGSGVGVGYGINRGGTPMSMGMSLPGMGSGGGGMGMHMGMHMGMGMGMGMYGSQSSVGYQQMLIAQNTGQWQHQGMGQSPGRQMAHPQPMMNYSSMGGLGSGSGSGSYGQDPSTISPSLAHLISPNRTGSASPFAPSLPGNLAPGQERRGSLLAHLAGAATEGAAELTRSDSRTTVGAGSGNGGGGSIMGKSPRVMPLAPAPIGYNQLYGAGGAGTSSSPSHVPLSSLAETSTLPPHIAANISGDTPPTADTPTSANHSTNNSSYAFDSRRGSLIGPGMSRDKQRNSVESVEAYGMTPLSNLSADDQIGAKATARPSLNRQDTVGSRLLYVSNLPFSMHWQELKDLFRTSGGTIMRADIVMGPDGRSKGYGNVLFQNEEDALAAKRAFDGYDYNGRTLKVRQDRHSSAQSSAGMSAGSQYAPYANNPYGIPLHMAGGLGSPTNPYPSILQQPFGQVSGSGVVDDGEDTSPPLIPGPRQASSSSSSSAKHEEGKKTTNMPPMRRAPTGGVGARARNGQHPGRIIMPSFSAGFGNPLSPVQARGGIPPMTPSMPGYNFHAYPSTPPMHPLSFLSPGIGPFSPTLNSPTGYTFNPFHAAPGAPLMTPGVPHPMSMTQSNAMYGAPGPGAGAIGGNPGSGAGYGIGYGEPEYFPQVGAGGMETHVEEMEESGYYQGVGVGGGNGGVVEGLDIARLEQQAQALDIGNGNGNGLGLSPTSTHPVPNLVAPGAEKKTIAERRRESLNLTPIPDRSSIKEQLENINLPTHLFSNPASPFSIDTSKSPFNPSSASASIDPSTSSTSNPHLPLSPGSGSTSRASFSIGIPPPGRENVVELLGSQSRLSGLAEMDRDRRASMGDEWPRGSGAGAGGVGISSKLAE